MAARCFLLLALFPLQVIASDYLPKDIWRDVDEWSLLESWYGGQLGAMQEPSLWEMSKANPSAQQYRLLVLPTFIPAYAIRVERGSVASSRLTYVLLNGAGGYEPGKIKTRDVRQIETARSNEFLSLLDHIDYWSFPTDVLADRRRSGEKVVICLDGTTFVLEAVVAGRYKLSTIHMCNLMDVDGAGELVDLFHELAGLGKVTPQVDKVMPN